MAIALTAGLWLCLVGLFVGIAFLAEECLRMWWERTHELRRWVQLKLDGIGTKTSPSGQYRSPNFDSDCDLESGKSSRKSREPPVDGGKRTLGSIQKPPHGGGPIRRSIHRGSQAGGGSTTPAHASGSPSTEYSEFGNLFEDTGSDQHDSLPRPPHGIPRLGSGSIIAPAKGCTTATVTAAVPSTTIMSTEGSIGGDHSRYHKLQKRGSSFDGNSRRERESERERDTKDTRTSGNIACAPNSVRGKSVFRQALPPSDPAYDHDESAVGGVDEAGISEGMPGDIPPALAAMGTSVGVDDLLTPRDKEQVIPKYVPLKKHGSLSQATHRRGLSRSCSTGTNTDMVVSPTLASFPPLPPLATGCSADGGGGDGGRRRSSPPHSPFVQVKSPTWALPPVPAFSRTGTSAEFPKVRGASQLPTPPPPSLNREQEQEQEAESNRARESRRLRQLRQSRSSRQSRQEPEGGNRESTLAFGSMYDTKILPPRYDTLEGSAAQAERLLEEGAGAGAGANANANARALARSGDASGRIRDARVGRNSQRVRSGGRDNFPTSGSDVSSPKADIKYSCISPTGALGVTRKMPLADPSPGSDCLCNQDQDQDNEDERQRAVSGVPDLSVSDTVDGTNTMRLRRIGSVGSTIQSPYFWGDDIAQLFEYSNMDKSPPSSSNVWMMADTATHSGTGTGTGIGTGVRRRVSPRAGYCSTEPAPVGGGWAPLSPRPKGPPPHFPVDVEVELEGGQTQVQAQAPVGLGLEALRVCVSDFEERGESGLASPRVSFAPAADASAGASTSNAAVTGVTGVAGTGEEDGPTSTLDESNATLSLSGDEYYSFANAATPKAGTVAREKRVQREKRAQVAMAVGTAAGTAVAPVTASAAEILSIDQATDESVGLRCSSPIYDRGRNLLGSARATTTTAGQSAWGEGTTGGGAGTARHGDEEGSAAASQAKSISSSGKISDSFVSFVTGTDGSTCTSEREDGREDARPRLGDSNSNNNNKRYGQGEGEGGREGAVGNESDNLGLGLGRGLAPRLAQRLALAQKAIDEEQHRVHVAELLIGEALVGEGVREVAEVSQVTKVRDKRPGRELRDLSSAEAFAQSLNLPFEELELIKLIGGGGFGQVYRGLWRGTPVAVKVLVPVAQRDLDDELSADFGAEVQMLAALRHPNVCLFMGACVVPPNRAIVTELVSRGSLWEALRDDNLPSDFTSDASGRGQVVYEGSAHGYSFTSPPDCWAWPVILKVAEGVACGMNYLHCHKPFAILHRDLKSANLLLDDCFNVKICDFGLARLKAFTNSMTGNCGTVQWMAPEVLASEKYTETADVYSFAIVCWELLERACPYEGMSQIQVAVAVLNNRLRPEIPAWCPPYFGMLIQNSWDEEATNRPSFGEILDFLRTPPQGV